ncbi:MAG: hypothetical protein A2Z74_02110 [Chloroflexi bacterium RBG_13_46_9]|nr:MAG: hypothetical protein A2Z74_02110 [Chloroflexi bacterium RBG_13_46_9]
MAVALVQQHVQNTAEKNGQDIYSPIDEVIVFCPKCKTLETIWLSAGFLVPTRKFRQSGNQVYHDCGSAEPCCFYHF